MINVIAAIKVKESHMDEFLEIFKSNISNVINEAGCIEYAPAIDFITDLAPQVCDSNTVTVIEKWETLESLQAHLIASHMLEYKEKVRDIVESVSLKVLEKV